ncbi:helix-turn-helix transcriptional regulator [Gemmata sp. JC673]|uniref:Helix-turn-helix transcriptional regulator n=1 Tax=Gemmata algarum TaxID=2975278 RepID=A0ABU5F6H7_9BACT|nr:helix-turn-helix transcriptional regulator [Gemmata algarum]MDY3561913.1 helix-turn-helix transcriptional regulator [Gemmata algarum]
MPSSVLRLRDLRAVHALVHECRDLGDDGAAWRRHWFAGVAGLVGADLVLGGELGGVRGGAPRDLGTAEWGWENGFNRAGWLRALELLRADPAYSPLMGAYRVRVCREDGVALCGSELVRDHDWGRGIEYQEVYRTIGVHRNLWCFRFIPGRADVTHGQIIARAAGRRDFAAREQAVVAEAYAAITPLMSGALAGFSDPAPSALAPRARDVLRCLLEGDSDKQIAARLGLSRYTVNQYAKVIFAHFGVASRAELLARWVRRGWGARCAWAGPGGGPPGPANQP